MGRGEEKGRRNRSKYGKRSYTRRQRKKRGKKKK